MSAEIKSDTSSIEIKSIEALENGHLLMCGLAIKKSKVSSDLKKEGPVMLPVVLETDLKGKITRLREFTEFGTFGMAMKILLRPGKPILLTGFAASQFRLGMEAQILYD